MTKLAMWTVLLSIACALLLSGCQGGGAPPGPQETQLAPEQAVAPGAGIDPALWARLTAELDRVLKQEGTAKRTNAPVIGKNSAVPNLSARSGGLGVLYEWSYRNQGDYDLNGEVNISDLAQIGIHFEKDTLSADWQQAQLADGDNNGVVNIGDITPIGQNFGGEVDGYEFQRRPGGPETEYEVIEEFPFLAGDKTTGLYPGYVRDTLPTIVGPTYRVVPFVETGSGREYGVPSVEYDSNVAGRHNWHTYRANNNRTAVSRTVGPAEVGEVWELELDGAVFFHEPCVDYLGTIYIGVASGSLADLTGEGMLYAIDGDGNILWRFRTQGSIAQSAAVNRQGEIVVGDTAGLIYCLTRDGKQLWRRPLSGLSLYAGTMIEDDGTSYAVSHTISGDSITSSTLYRLTPDGAVDWSRPANDIVVNAPLMIEASTYCMIDRAGEVYAYAIDGTLLHNFVLADPPSGGLIPTGVSASGVFLYYSDGTEYIRIHMIDNSFHTQIDLDEEPITSPVINTQNHFIVGTRSDPPDSQNKLNYYDAGTEVWDMTVGGDFLTAIALDQADRIYFGTFVQDPDLPTNNNGISCVLPDQTIAWFHPTDTRLVFSVIVADEDLLVAVASPAISSAESSLLIGIRGT